MLSGIVKRAVALGCYLQNPLVMFAALCGPGKEILSWKLSPLENFLPANEKYGMVDVTNQVGLDVNLAASHEWLFGPLQFVSGLRPSKAASLQRSLVKSRPIFAQKEFRTAHGLGKKVFVNAVGFLQVCKSGLAANSSLFFDLLDDTRIHPESYVLAFELAKDVDIHLGGNNCEEDLLMMIERVRDRPNMLKHLRIDVYLSDKKRENKNFRRKRETLEEFRRDLIQGFQD